MKNTNKVTLTYTALLVAILSIIPTRLVARNVNYSVNNYEDSVGWGSARAALRGGTLPVQDEKWVGSFEIVGDLELYKTATLKYDLTKLMYYHNVIIVNPPNSPTTHLDRTIPVRSDFGKVRVEKQEIALAIFDLPVERFTGTLDFTPLRTGVNEIQIGPIGFCYAIGMAGELTFIGKCGEMTDVTRSSLAIPGLGTGALQLYFGGNDVNHTTVPQSSLQLEARITPEVPIVSDTVIIDFRAEALRDIPDGVNLLFEVTTPLMLLNYPLGSPLSGPISKGAVFDFQVQLLPRSYERRSFTITFLTLVHPSEKFYGLQKEEINIDRDRFQMWFYFDSETGSSLGVGDWSIREIRNPEELSSQVVGLNSFVVTGIDGEVFNRVYQRFTRGPQDKHYDYWSKLMNEESRALKQIVSKKTRAKSTLERADKRAKEQSDRGARRAKTKNR